jgi:hypothetical protein
VALFSHVPQTALGFDGSLVLPTHHFWKGNMEVMMSTEQQWNDTDSAVNQYVINL